MEQLGSEHFDKMTPEGFLSNNAGGILGAISTGQEVVVLGATLGAAEGLAY